MERLSAPRAGSIPATMGESGGSRISIDQGGLGFTLWMIGWLFTIGALGLSFGRGLLGLILWPYYLGVHFAGVFGW